MSSNNKPSDREPTSSSSAPLKSPDRPIGPPRRLPTPRSAPKRSEVPSRFRELALTLLVLACIVIAIASIFVFVSVISTQTLAFGYSIEELPTAASRFCLQLVREFLPAEWTPKIGVKGRASLSSLRSVGSLDYRSLRVITEKELKEHDGSRSHLPIYLSITGLVFDVSVGRNHYQPGGGYHFLAGKDATVSFETGCFEDECFAMQGVGWGHISQDGRRGIRDWVQQYKQKYTLIGRLQGVFELYHANDPAQKHQKYITPLRLEQERAVRAEEINNQP